MLKDVLDAGTLVGEYRIERLVGEGSFGKVYAAIHPVIGTAAAIKVLDWQYSSKAEWVSRFVSEARAVNQIRHRNIVDIFAFGQLVDGRHYFAMELLEGRTLRRELDLGGRMPLARALPILRRIARALDAAHRAGIAHRDLKPDNVFLTYDEDRVCHPKLLDFGIAKLIGDGPTQHRTATGMPLGTPLYMSPEQCRGAVVDHRTDVYAFGVMAHEMLVGAPPFDDETVVQLMVKHLSSVPPSMSSRASDLPPILDSPVLRMLEKDPSLRQSSAGAAADALCDAARRAGIELPGASQEADRVGASEPVGEPAADPTQGTGAWLAERSGTPQLAATVAAPSAAQGSPTAVEPPPTGVAPAGAMPAAVTVIAGPAWPMPPAANPAHPATHMQAGPTAATGAGMSYTLGRAPAGPAVAAAGPSTGGAPKAVWIVVAVGVLLLAGSLLFAVRTWLADSPSASDAPSSTAEQSPSAAEAAPGGVTVTPAAVAVGARITASRKMELAVDAAGIRRREAMALSAEVTGLEGDRISQARLQITSCRERSEEAGVGVEDEPCEVEGKTYLVDLPGAGRPPQVHAAGGESASDDELEKVSETAVALLRPNPLAAKLGAGALAPGATFSLDRDEADLVLGFAADDEAYLVTAATLTLRSIKSMAEGHRLSFDASISLTIPDSGLSLAASMTGQVTLSSAGAWPLEVDLAGPLLAGGAAFAPGQPGIGRLTVHRQVGLEPAGSAKE